MKINFHPRGTSKTIIDKDLEAVDYFCISYETGEMTYIFYHGGIVTIS